MTTLTGKTALVTGATGGLGRAIAHHLHQRGATVALTGTREEALKSLAKDLNNAPFFPCPLDQESPRSDLIPWAEKALGTLDILVNNAGVTRDMLLMRQKHEDMDRVLTLNLHVPLYLMKAVLKGMMKQRFGRIINISSVVGTTGNAGQVAYCASKAGLEGATRALAKECATRNITVNCVAPGFMASSMTESLTEDQKNAILGAIPMGKMGTGLDVAGCVAFLASDEAQYITGHTLHVNGGMAMG